MWMYSLVLCYVCCAMPTMHHAPCTTTTTKALRALCVTFKKLITYFFDYSGSVSDTLMMLLLGTSYFLPPNQFNARWALVMYLYMGELMTELEMNNCGEIRSKDHQCCNVPFVYDKVCFTFQKNNGNFLEWLNPMIVNRPVVYP